MGFAEVHVASRDGSFTWTDWELLDPAKTFLRDDSVGFSIAVLKPNHTLIVES